jgi:hypothetical protein
LVVKAGALVGRAGRPVQVRNPDDAGVETDNASFMKSSLPIAGLAKISVVRYQNKPP